MPTKMLRDSIATSRKLMSVSPEAFRLWTVLLTQTDDFGLYLADPTIILGRCFPYLMDKISSIDIQHWIMELQDKRLIGVYEVKGKWYLRFINYFKHNTPKAKNSRFPGPDGKKLSKDSYEGVVTSWDEFRNVSEHSGTFLNIPLYPYPNPYPDPNLKNSSTTATGGNGTSTKHDPGEPHQKPRPDRYRFLDHYSTLCERTTGIKPIINYSGQHERIALMVLQRVTLEDAMSALDAYFALKEDRLSRKCYPLAWFPQRLPELLKHGTRDTTTDTEELIKNGAPITRAE